MEPCSGSTSRGCQFHQHYTRAFFVRTSFRQLFSSYKYVEKRRLYKKCVRKMLIKLTRGLFFNNILKAAFLYESVLRSFFNLQFGCVFFCKRISAHSLMVNVGKIDYYRCLFYHYFLHQWIYDGITGL